MRDNEKRNKHVISKCSIKNIDKNIKPLVLVLRSLGFETIGSCGGHKNPTDFQNPYGRWFISFGFCDKSRDRLKNIMPILKKYKVEIGGEGYAGAFDIEKEHTWISLRGKCSILEKLEKELEEELNKMSVKQDILEMLENEVAEAENEGENCLKEKLEMDWIFCRSYVKRLNALIERIEGLKEE